MIPQLSSLPGAPANIWLNFAAHYEAAWGPYRNVSTAPLFSVVGDREQTITTRTWELVSQAFAAWNVNVTTVQPASLVHGVTQTVVVTSTPPMDVIPPHDNSGYTWLGSFANAAWPNVNYVFSFHILEASDTVESAAQALACVICHECGHAFGLEHQYRGNVVDAGPNGDGEGGPYMGIAWAHGHWTIGVRGDGVPQDDVAIISTVLSLRPPKPRPVVTIETLEMNAKTFAATGKVVGQDGQNLDLTVLVGSRAYVLAQKYAFIDPGQNFHWNNHGLNEIWFQGAVNSFGNPWYLMLPTGELREWNKGAGATGKTLAILGADYWHWPALLFHAQPPDQKVTVDLTTRPEVN